VAEIDREPGERGAHLGEGVGMRAIHEAERGVEEQSADAAPLLPSHRNNAGEWLRFRCSAVDRTQGGKRGQVRAEVGDRLRERGLALCSSVDHAETRFVGATVHFARIIEPVAEGAIRARALPTG